MIASLSNVYCKAQKKSALSGGFFCALLLLFAIHADISLLFISHIRGSHPVL